MSNSAQKIDPKKLQEEISGRIREFYPYLLAFYFLSLFISIFSETWSNFFNWPAFHVVMIFFSLLFALTFKFRFKFRRVFKFKHIFKVGSFKIIGLVKNSSREVSRQVHQYFTLIYSKLVKINRKAWLKIFIIITILIFALFKEIGVLDFLVLLYALISFLFIVNSRYSAAAALIFLAACPFLLIFKKDVLAENSAIYAYYFLVITVLTQIREFKKDKNNSILEE